MRAALPDAAAWAAAMAAAHGRPTRFGYDAVTSRGKRQAPTGVLRAEDLELRGNERRRLLSATRDLHRNFTLAGWALRKHLDYVSTFRFQSKTGNKPLDRKIERKLARWGRACDVAGRHPWRRLLRQAEARRTIDGDFLLLKLENLQVQGIEGDRIRQTPVDTITADVQHGVKTDPYGKPVAYAISKRRWAGGGFQFERWVEAEHAVPFGYYDRLDQLRGISPLAPAVNGLRDTYEGIDYALAKAKLAQLFGLVFFRNQADPVGEHVATTDTDPDTGVETTRYQVDFGKGPLKLELEPGDDAKFLESNSPGPAFQEFVTLLIALTLKALDIPYSFWAENYSNYSGSRQALLQYELSASIKRADSLDFQDAVTEWLLDAWIEDGELPGVADVDELAWEWIPVGLPWIDPLNEVQANLAALSAGLTTRTRLLREQGLDFHEVTDELAAEVAYLAANGLPTNANPLNAAIPRLATSASRRRKARTMAAERQPIGLAG